MAALYASALYHLSLWGRPPSMLAVRLEDPWPGDPAHGMALLEGEYRFAGEAVKAATPPWTDAQRPPDWRAALHRFGWLTDLAAVGGEAANRLARDLTADWLARCDIWDPVPWRADVIGDRLVAWITHFERLALRPQDHELERKLLASMARQMRHLSRVAVREPAGMPRLHALRGLVVASAALGNRRRLDRALAQLQRELDVQILPDGGHASRNPAAQIDALRCLVEARAALVAAQVEVPGALYSAIDRAAPMLRFFRHGDGRLALFNGADEGDGGLLDLVLARADAKGRAPLSAPHTGFQRLQASGTLVLVETGAPPPPGFDRDAHAGTLSFEMSHGRERLIVNCGGYHGASPQWRTAARGTAAHSALIVADTNSSEIRPDGTLGRRPSAVTCERAEEEGSQWIAASHDGYQATHGLIHARQLFLAADGDDLRGEDRLTGRPGQGFAIRFHLHPDVEASLTQDANTVMLRLPSGIGWRFRAQGAVLSLAESIYLGDGDIRKTQQVVLDGHVATNGASVKWALRRDTRRGSEAAETATDPTEE
jgi:uncharacterized heparinase superfamily protein